MQIDLTRGTEEGAEEMLLRLSGRFDFTTRSQFMEHANQAIAVESAQKIKVDLSNTNYIDSSALGMLLMLRDKAKKLDKTVSLVSPRGPVRQIIDTAQFDKLFTIN